MTMSQRRRAHVALAAFLALGACSRGDVSRADSSTAARGAAPVPSTMPGTLTKPLASYTGDEFYDFVQKLSFSGGQTRQRTCTGNPACSGPQPSLYTMVQVDAVTTQDSLAVSNTPKYGVVYMRALNKGTAEEARYSMQPGANLQYYLVVTTDSTQKAMQWQLAMLDTTANARKLRTIGGGPFLGCDHAWTAGAKADFKTCALASVAHDSTLHLGLMLQGGGDAPIWVACSNGCCTAS
jgi:hypothetical protein